MSSIETSSSRSKVRFFLHFPFSVSDWRVLSAGLLQVGGWFCFICLASEDLLKVKGNSWAESQLRSLACWKVSVTKFASNGAHADPSKGPSLRPQSQHPHRQSRQDPGSAARNWARVRVRAILWPVPSAVRQPIGDPVGEARVCAVCWISNSILKLQNVLPWVCDLLDRHCQATTVITCQLAKKALTGYIQLSGIASSALNLQSILFWDMLIFSHALFSLRHQEWLKDWAYRCCLCLHKNKIVAAQILQSFKNFLVLKLSQYSKSDTVTGLLPKVSLSRPAETSQTLKHPELALPFPACLSWLRVLPQGLGIDFAGKAFWSDGQTTSRGLNLK